MNSSEICQDKTLRRRRIRERAAEAGGNEPNGIDYLEFEEGNQTTFHLFFLNKAPQNVGTENIRITGGVRIRDIKATGVTPCYLEDREEDDCIQVTVNKPGDFSTYTLHLVNARDGRPTDEPLDGFDPRYAQIDFSFKANCKSELDCASPDTCYTEPLPEPEINYLAKDYASFRQLILDRLSLTMPDWKERHVPDIGIALTELFAYVGDYLSYYQDAVATESYLDTARERISVRRHARLIDYTMHEGCNARAWVTIKTGQDVTLDNPKEVYFITGRAASATLDKGDEALTPDDLRGLNPADYEVFEPLLQQHRRPRPITLYEAHNRISFYTWGDRECCLPRGTTRATLMDQWAVEEEEPPDVHEDEVKAVYEQSAHDDDDGENGQEEYEEQRRDEYRMQKGGYDEPPPRTKRDPELDRPAPERERRLHLRVGDVLIFEEVMGAKTGLAADADASRRQAVRLTKVEPRVDTLYDQPVVEIEWALEDALLFTLCLSAISEAPSCRYLEDVSVARGNVLLVDHGRTMRPEKWEVPEAEELPAGCLGADEPRETILKSARFRPRLRHAPVTYRAPYPTSEAVANMQAQFLEGLIEEVRHRVEQLCRRTRHGQTLSQEDLAELATIFGAETLAEVGLLRPGARDRHQQGSKQQWEACERLVANLDRFLAKKTDWVMVLRERTLNGYTMTEAEKREIADLFGERTASGLRALEDQLPGPASLALRQLPRDALPCILIRTVRAAAPAPEERKRNLPPSLSFYPRWLPQRDLLGSNPQDRHFMAEVDNEGRAYLRFGNGELGRAPDPLTTLKATYRTGNGAPGNVGAETISHIVFRKTKLVGVTLRVRNPLPAQGGIDPEPVTEVKMLAPGAVRQDLQRAIIAEDYARLAERSRPGQVQRATARLRWTGGWYRMQAIIDPRGSEEAQSQLLSQIEGSLYPYRRLGHDLGVVQAQYVPLDIAISVCVLPHYLRGHVHQALSEVFSNRVLPGGRRGFFHPDNLTFGDSIFLSRLVAAAQSVEGVESVQVTKLQRLYEFPNGELESGVLPIGPMEVARLDSDPNFPEHGILVLDVRGGR